MSIRVLDWVLRYSEETLGNRLVLIALADRANDDGTGAYPSVATLARDTRLSERQVQRCLSGLKSRGSIIENGKSEYGTTVYDVQLGGANMSGGDIYDAIPGADVTRTVLSTPPSTSVANAPSADGASALLTSGPKSVNRTRTTELERHRARQILNVWNEVAGQDLRSDDWLAKIIMRLREYPEATVEEHALIIRTVLANPWWTGPASPSVVYGNGAQFERSIEAVRQSWTVSEEIKTALEGMRRSRERRRAG